MCWGNQPRCIPCVSVLGYRLPSVSTERREGLCHFTLTCRNPRLQEVLAVDGVGVGSLVPEGTPHRKNWKLVEQPASEAGTCWREQEFPDLITRLNLRLTVKPHVHRKHRQVCSKTLSCWKLRSAATSAAAHCWRPAGLTVGQNRKTPWDPALQCTTHGVQCQ